MAEIAAASAPAEGQGRQTYLVDRRFQLKYALLMAGAGVLVALLFGFWVYQVHLQATQLVQMDPETRVLVRNGERLLLYSFIAISALMALALALLGVVMTHRVAGPIFVIGHYMTVLAQGRYPRMRTLRKQDELRSFFQVFLSAVAALKTREARHAAVLEDVAARIRAALPRAPELAPALDWLEQAARERRLALSVDDSEPTPLYVAAPTGGASH
jgi:hypothetical protein